MLLRVAFWAIVGRRPPHRARRSGVLVAGLVSVVVAAGPPPAGAESSTWRVAYGSDPSAGQPVLAEGRVWWVSAEAGSLQLHSRGSAGHGLRVVTLDVPAPLTGAPEAWTTFGAEPSGYGLSVARGVALVQARFVGVQDPGFGDRLAEPSFVAAFDARTGTRLDVAQETGRAARLVPGSTMVALGPATGTWRPRELRALAGSRLPGGLVRPDQVAGRFLLQLRGRSERSAAAERLWSEDGLHADASSWRVAKVLDLATGRLRYAVTARRLVGVAAPGLRDAQVAIPRLFDDGSLAVVAARGLDRRGAAPGGGIRPIAVDPRGRILRLGVPTRHAYAAGGVSRRGRGLVALADLRERGCSGLWLMERRSGRGRRLSRAGRAFPPIGWTGDVAVWPRRAPDSFSVKAGDFAGEPYLTVDVGLRSVDLRRGATPRC